MNSFLLKNRQITLKNRKHLNIVAMPLCWADVVCYLGLYQSTMYDILDRIHTGD